MPASQGPPGPIKQVHVIVSPDEHKRIKVVAAHLGKNVAELFREWFMPELDAAYRSARFNGSPAKEVKS